jgi:tetratricopeptide (TPR) repeat protein
MFSHHPPTLLSERVSYWLLLLLVVLLPVCTLPFALVSTPMAKIATGVVLVLLSGILYAISRIRAQEAMFPKSVILCTFWALPVVYMLATLFSGNAAVRFGGEQLTVDSAGFVTVLALAATLTTLMSNTLRRALGVYAALLLGAVVFAVAQVVVYVLGIDVGTSVALIGSLKDVAIFFGLAIIGALCALVFLPVTALLRTVLYVVLLGALFFLGVANLALVWQVFGLFALGILVWQLSMRGKGAPAISFAAVLVLVVSAFFLFSGEYLSGGLARMLQVGDLDARPTWNTTIEIAQGVWHEHMLLGVGPGRFGEAWAAHMPREVQGTDFWNADFAFGVGFIPTAFVTVGMLGVLAWAAFLLSLLFAGARAFLRSNGEFEKRPLARYVAVTSFVGAVYVWGMVFFQNVSPVLLLYAAVLTGVFVGVRVAHRSVGVWQVRFAEQPQVGFLVTLAGAVFVVVALSGLYHTGERVFAESSYRNALRVVETSGDLERADALVSRAIQIYPLDVYYRAKSTLDFTQLQQMMRSPEETAESVQERALLLLQSAIDHAERATLADPRDYRNWLGRASLYQNIIQYGVEGAQEKAYEAFDRVLDLRPLSPSVYVARATLERAAGNEEEARAQVAQAITIRNNYTDAVFLLAQMQLEAGEMDAVLRSVQAVTLFEPRNYTAHFKLGLLHYWNGDFADAQRAFEKAVSLNGSYANARYFLGLTYWREGMHARALEEMEAVLETNPGNAEVLQLIRDITAGKPAPRTPGSEDILGAQVGADLGDGLDMTAFGASDVSATSSGAEEDASATQEGVQRDADNSDDPTL